ncbi:MAG: lysostaphin resistance A-like protein [Candidatus Acidiferrales bacterium]
MEKVKWVFLAGDGRVRPGWRALLYLPLFAVMLAPFVFLIQMALGPGGHGEGIGIRTLLGAVAGCVGALAAAAALLRLLDRRPFKNLGVWFYDGWGKELGLGLGGGLALMTVMVAPLAAGGLIELRLAAIEPLGLLTGLAWSAGILAPAAAGEEFIFRGYPFQRLVEAWGAMIPAVGISALFGLAHANNPNATWFSTANTVLAGIWLAVAYLKTRALWLPIGVHFSWNFVMGFGYGLPISGNVLPWRLVEAAPGGPVWLTGGDYGPEGGILCTGVLVVVTVWMMQTDKLKVAPQMARCLGEGTSAEEKSGTQYPVQST